MRRIILLACVAIALCAACSTKREAKSNDAQKGAELYVSRNCITCHGPEGEGRPTGPELRGMGEYYTIESMVEYLKDPDAAIARDARLRERAQGIGTLMPKYDYLPPEELKAIAVYVLWLD